MAKIVIACNHDYISSTGGCELVVKQICKYMTRLKHQCFVLSRSYTTPPKIYEEVSIRSCGNSFYNFINVLNDIKPDFLLIYSDCFVFWPQILAKSQDIGCKKILFPVGFNSTLGNNFYTSLFKKKYNQFKIVVHSSRYKDYDFCVDNNIPVEVIPNGVDAEEFQMKPWYFKNKYGINDTKLTFLNVSNFFPGKGQEFLPKVLDAVKEDLDKRLLDFNMIFICSSSKIGGINRIRDGFIKSLKNHTFNSKVLIDIPREDVVQSYFESDLFLFPSQKEVAPLVILEAIAANLPWVSFNVGNVGELSGGVCIRGEKDRSNNIMFSQKLNVSFYNAIIESVLKRGRANVTTDNFDWSIISARYNDLFLQKEEKLI